MGSSWTELRFTEMRRIWQSLVRVIFWSFERGSWPYDLMVIAIVLFVLATPRRWFHDQPQSSAAANSNIMFISEDGLSGTRTYRIDAKLLPAQKRTAKPGPELERETHDMLGKNVEELKERTFQVRRI